MNPKAPSLSEFLGPDDERGAPAKAQSVEEMLSIGRRWAAATGTDFSDG